MTFYGDLISFFFVFQFFMAFLWRFRRLDNVPQQLYNQLYTLITYLFSTIIMICEEKLRMKKAVTFGEIMMRLNPKGYRRF